MDPVIEAPPIRFAMHASQGPYGCFSNFSDYAITIDGVQWPSVEHYYQAQKFLGHRDEKEIRLMASAADAARAGRDRGRPCRRDWKNHRDAVMKVALMAKFTQHEFCRRKLLETGLTTLVAILKSDPYWADDGDGNGKNRFGRMLMELRESLRSGNATAVTQ